MKQCGILKAVQMSQIIMLVSLQPLVASTFSFLMDLFLTQGENL